MTRKKSAKQPAPHFLVPGFLPGWLVCRCGCGYVAVCRHCVPTAPVEVAHVMCPAERRRLHQDRHGSVSATQSAE